MPLLETAESSLWRNRPEQLMARIVAIYLPTWPSTSTRVNLLRPLAPMLADPRARDTSGRCICCDEDFLHAYKRKYAIGLLL
jgi:hypothetical protein